MNAESQNLLQFPGRKVWLVRIALALGLLLILVLVGLGIKNLLSAKTSVKKPVTTIKIMPDTPPPPPPPPKEPPKEQPKEQPKEIKMEQPKPQEAPQPPAEQLKMEGAAGDGPSPFAAGAVNNEYKGGDVSTKIGGKPNARQFAWFTGMLKSQIEEALAKDKKLASGDYKAIIKVWVGNDGRIERYELSGSSGNPDTDQLIKAALGQVPALSEGPPEDMPQPVKLRITSRSTG